MTEPSGAPRRPVPRFGSAGRCLVPAPGPAALPGVCSGGGGRGVFALRSECFPPHRPHPRALLATLWFRAPGHCGAGGGGSLRVCPGLLASAGARGRGVCPRGSCCPAGSGQAVGGFPWRALSPPRSRGVCWGCLPTTGSLRWSARLCPPGLDVSSVPRLGPTLSRF